MDIDVKLVAAIKAAVPSLPVFAVVAPQTELTRPLPYVVYTHVSDSKDSIVCPGVEVWNFEIELITVCSTYDASKNLRNQIVTAVHAMPECQGPIDTNISDYYNDDAKVYGHVMQFSMKDEL